MLYVLTISLGPVQDFIATARRCRDLWFGSWLLSELSKAAAQAIGQHIETTNAGTLIFPPPGTPFGDKAESVSNKILAVVAEPQAVVEVAERAARARLEAIAQETFQRFEGKIESEAALAQVKDLLEWNWGAALINNGDYATARLQAEKAVAARKACRDFNSVGIWAGSAFKSSFDGAREGVVKREAQSQTEEEGFKKFSARKGEVLCGVALLKRQGERGQVSVASTSHIAAQGLLNRWNTLYPGAPQAQRDNVTGFIGLMSTSLGLTGTELETMLDTAPRFDPLFKHHDGHLLFPSRLEEFFSNKEHKKDAKAALRRLLKELNQGQDAREPNPYYALILADGDGMGKAISEAALQGETVSIELSRRLASFAREVRETVENQGRGTLIYAGGDDVLALLPLHNALDITRKIARQFAHAFDGFTGITTRPTLSVGMVVYHHLEPLSEALKLVREAEKAAKAVDGKNALAITVAKRSGGEETVAGKWSFDPFLSPEQDNPLDLNGLDGRLQFFMAWAKAGEVAAGLAYEWRDLILRVPLHPVEGEANAQSAARLHNEMVHKIWLSEAKRILERKKKRGGEHDVADWLFKGLNDLLETAASHASGNTASNTSSNSNWLRDLSQEFIVAKEFAVAQTLALYQSPVLPVAQATPSTQNHAS